MQGGLGRFEKQITLLTTIDADITALQEIAIKGVDLYKKTLNVKAYKHILDTINTILLITCSIFVTPSN